MGTVLEVARRLVGLANTKNVFLTEMEDDLRRMVHAHYRPLDEMAMDVLTRNPKQAPYVDLYACHATYDAVGILRGFSKIKMGFPRTCFSFLFCFKHARRSCSQCINAHTLAQQKHALRN